MRFPSEFEILYYYYYVIAFSPRLVRHTITLSQYIYIHLLSRLSMINVPEHFCKIVVAAAAAQASKTAVTLLSFSVYIVSPAPQNISYIHSKHVYIYILI